MACTSVVADTSTGGTGVVGCSDSDSDSDSGNGNGNGNGNGSGSGSGTGTDVDIPDVDIPDADFRCGASTAGSRDTAGTSTAIDTITGSTGTAIGTIAGSTGTVVGGDIAGRPDAATAPGTGFCAAGTSTDFASGPDTPTRADISCGANGSIATGIDTAGTIIATGTSTSSGTDVGSRGADDGTVGGRIRTDAHTASSPHVDDRTCNGVNTAGRLGVGDGGDITGNTTIGTRPGTGTATRFRVTAGVRTRPGADADHGVDRAGHRG
ncbi:hypothetical protein [Nocardia sp. XZ_19_369]|uniref:hypothetical protein n=1 Tax=Nocardia sp. XZ_19_369 TaxID=2769487 RepID=UPI001E47F84B|nr:hypothetical protein [Nocardia sp. XZ_19_369]